MRFPLCSEGFQYSKLHPHTLLVPPELLLTMQPPNWTEFLQCCVCTNKFDSTIYVPISLTCGHTLCTKCLTKLKTRVCPYDKIPINPLTESLPKNYAILQLLEEKLPGVDEGRYPDLSTMGVANGDRTHYLSAMEAVGTLFVYMCTTIGN